MDMALATALEATEKLKEMGHSAVVVGGAVRDLLLCRDIRDVDIATSAPLRSVVEIWPGSKLVGKAPRVTAIVSHGGIRIDVSSFQGKSLEEDLGRRDLTINALALSSDGRIIDPWGGAVDLSAGILRFTGNPGARLEEDPLRGVRLGRFASWFPRFTIDEPSALECGRFAEPVGSLPLQRTGKEILLSLEEDPALFVRTLQGLGLLEAVMPFWASLAETEKTFSLRWTATATEMTGDRGIRALSMLASAGENIREICTSWCWPAGLAKDVENLARSRTITFGQLDSRIFAKLFDSMGPEWMDRLFLAGLTEGISIDDRRETTGRWADNRVKAALWSSRLQKNSGIVSGEDIMLSIGAGEGKLVGEILSAIREGIADGVIENREEALMLAKNLSPKR